MACVLTPWGKQARRWEASRRLSACSRTWLTPGLTQQAYAYGRGDAKRACTLCYLVSHVYIMHIYKMYSFWRTFLSRPRVYSCALGCGARKGVECTLRRKFGPRSCSVARALGVQSRTSWFFFTGLRSATPSRPGPGSFPISAFRSAAITPLLLLHRPSSSQVVYFVASTVE